MTRRDGWLGSDDADEPDDDTLLASRRTDADEDTMLASRRAAPSRSESSPAAFRPQALEEHSAGDTVYGIREAPSVPREPAARTPVATAAPSTRARRMRRRARGSVAQLVIMLGGIALAMLGAVTGLVVLLMP